MERGGAQQESGRKGRNKAGARKHPRSNVEIATPTPSRHPWSIAKRTHTHARSLGHNTVGFQKKCGGRKQRCGANRFIRQATGR